MSSFLFSGILAKENNVGLILAPLLCLCIARKKNHRSVLILTTLFSGIVSRTTSCINPTLLSGFVSETTMRINPIFSVPVLFCSAFDMFVKTYSDRIAAPD